MYLTIVITVVVLFQVIYMARNPKDLVVSYYQFHRSLRTMSYRGTFQEFCRRFMNDKRKYVGYWDTVKLPSGFKSVNSCTALSLLYLSLFVSLKVGYGSWFEHVQEFWEHRMDSNVLFLKYEDIYKVISSLSRFFFFFFRLLLLALVLYNSKS